MSRWPAAFACMFMTDNNYKYKQQYYTTDCISSDDIQYMINLSVDQCQTLHHLLLLFFDLRGSVVVSVSRKIQMSNENHRKKQYVFAIKF